LPSPTPAWTNSGLNITGSVRRPIATCLAAAWASVFERPTTNESKVSRGSSGEPPRPSRSAGAGAATALKSIFCRQASRFSTGALSGCAMAQGGAVRIAAERTARSMRRTAGRSDCQQASNRSL
jgi:hypothetical protein